MSNRRYSKAAENFREVLSVVHTATGYYFTVDGNRVTVGLEDNETDSINTYDYAPGRNGVQTMAQLRAVAADYLNNLEEA